MINIRRANQRVTLFYFVPLPHLKKNVHSDVICFVFSELVVPKILLELCSGDLTPMKHLETQQALVKQFAEILDFVLKFDDLKVSYGSV